MFEDQIDELVEAATSDPDREKVIKAVNRARAMHAEEHYTVILAESPENPEIREPVSIVDGPVLTAEDQEKTHKCEEGITDLSEYGIEDQTINLGAIEGSYERFLENVRQYPGFSLMRYPRLSEDSQPDREVCSIELEAAYNVQDFWYQLHRLTIRPVD